MTSPSLRNLVFILLTAAACVSDGSRAAVAEFVWDEFDQTQEFRCGRSGPLLCGVDYAPWQATFSPVPGERRLAISALYYRSGSIDANLSAPSALTMHIDEAGEDDLLPNLEITYRFEEGMSIDLTEGGHSDSLFLDFASISGTAQPLYLRVFYGGTANGRPSGRYAAFANLPAESGPFTLRVPLSDIRSPAGEPPDLTRMTNLQFKVIFADPEVGSSWRATLDRVRVGSSVPEPRANVLFLTMLAITVMHTRSSLLLPRRSIR
ncbi:MAG: hypothetical protein R3E01_33080 [Pirellulaceae bacterium]